MFTGNVFQIFSRSYKQVPASTLFLNFLHEIQSRVALFSRSSLFQFFRDLKHPASLKTVEAAVKKKNSHAQQSLHSVTIQTGSKQCPGIVRLQVKTSSGFILDDLTQQEYPQTGRRPLDIGNLLCLYIPAPVEVSLHLLLIIEL